MSEIKFSNNYSDLSQQSGVNAGFQFEFFCQRCNDTWRSEFTPYRSAQASGWLNKASGMFGGMLGEVGQALEGMSESGWGSARTEAFKQAEQQASSHFHRCAKCHSHVCDLCWNKAKGLCLNCAPDAEVEIEAARNQGEISAATENAVQEGMKRGGKIDVTRDRQLVCPECGTETHGGKFCPNCGHKMAVLSSCPECNAQIPPDAKFCPECGHKT